MTTPRAEVRDTDRSTNLEIRVGDAISVEEMEALLADVAATIGLAFSRITTLGAKKYPGNRHWHLKQNPKEKGCLDVTYWPNGPLMWVTMRNYEPDWVRDAGHRLGPAIERQLKINPPDAAPQRSSRLRE